VNPILRGCAYAGLFAALAIASGCTVRPMLATYGTTFSTKIGTPANALSSIAVEPVNDRVGQQVRNELIFLIRGGAAQPENSLYTMHLDVSTLLLSAARRQVASEQEPTAKIVTVRAAYRVVENATGNVRASGRREITSAFDVPRQEFAAYRAERDAEDRAARELAQLLYLAVGQELARTPVQ